MGGLVERAREASTALRELDQEAVDRIVWAMTVAGLENAVELAELPMEETHFGVLGDKVIKIEARTAMANAATIAGLAFSNAFVGLNHALAHPVGARFGIAHGRANAIFLPHVLRYNASLPSKFMPAPGYSAYIAPEKCAQIAFIVGLGGKSEQDRRERLFTRVDQLLAEVDEPRTLVDCGVKRQEFEKALPELAKAAFMDPSIRTNPPIPMIREVIELLEAGYSGGV